MESFSFSLFRCICFSYITIYCVYVLLIASLDLISYIHACGLILWIDIVHKSYMSVSELPCSMFWT